MRDRAEKILRYAGLVVGALVLLQLAHALFQACQLVGVKSPAMPTLETESNLTAAAVSPQPPVHGPRASQATNALAEKSGRTPGRPTSQNRLSGATNLTEKAGKMPEPPGPRSNTSTTINLAMLDARHAKRNFVSTNGVTPPATNVESAGSATNFSKRHHPQENHMEAMAVNGAPRMPGMAGKGSALPPEVQAEVDQIVNSGIFGPVVHPPPMGLLGIAGDTAFLRTDSGQSGLVKVGDSLGDLKLLRIGINRVLVEQDGQQKELTIFDGYGGDSLLTNRTENTNENIQIQKKAD
jgi:hypothetical protein